MSTAQAAPTTLSPWISKHRQLIAWWLPLLLICIAGLYLRLAYLGSDLPYNNDPPVNSLGEALADPQVAHRKMVTTVEHPTAGEVRMTRTPLIFPHVEGNDARPAPLLGQHTIEILRDVVKYSPEQIENLIAQGTVQ